MEPRKRKKKKLRIQFLKRLVQGIMSGRFRSEQSSGRGVVVIGKRKFVSGRDPLSSYDWKTMFRARPEIYTRERERQAFLMVAADVSDSMAFTTSEVAKVDVSMLFLQLAHDFSRAGNLAGALIFGREKMKFQRPSRPGAIQDIIDEVACYRYPSPVSSPTNIQPYLEELRVSLRERCLILIVSDFCFELNYQKELRALADYHDVVPVVVEDPEDNLSAPWGSYFTFKDMETGQTVSLKKIEENRNHVDFFRQIRLEPFIANTTEGEERICIRLNEFFSRRRY